MLARKTPMRKSRKKSATAEERRHLERVGAMPCAACGHYESNVHHVISTGFARITRTHEKVIPLCRFCHQDGPYAIHRIGSRAWNERFFDQMELADRLWSERDGLETD